MAAEGCVAVVIPGGDLRPGVFGRLAIRPGG